MRATEKPDSWNGVRVPYEVAVAQLREIIHSRSEAVGAAFVALAYSTNPSSIDVLREAMGSRDAFVRRAALEAISMRPEALSLKTVILRAFGDASEYVVRTACDATERLGITEAHAHLLGLLKRPSSGTRVAALRAIEKVREPTDFQVVLDKLTADASPAVKRQAGWTLRAHIDASNWRTLFDTWSRDALARHRVWACEIAAEWGSAEVDAPVSEMVHDANGHVRKAAKHALGEKRAVTRNTRPSGILGAIVCAMAGYYLRSWP